MAGQGKAVKVKMLFFGPLAERLGEREIDVALEHGTTGNRWIARFDLSEFLDSGLRGVSGGLNGAPLDTPLRDQASVSIIPPVSG